MPDPVQDQLPLNRPAPPGAMPVDPASVWAAQQARSGATSMVPSSDTDLTAEDVKSSQLSRQLAGGESTAAQGLAGQIAGLQEKQATGAKDLGYTPNMQPVTGLWSLIKDLGRGLMIVGTATKPGQDIEGVVYRRPREEYAQRAQQISELQEQQKAELGAVAPTLGAGSRWAVAGAREQQVEANKERADAYTKQVEANVRDIDSKVNARAVELQQKWKSLDQNARKLELDKMLQDTMRDVANIHAGAQRDVGYAMSDAMTNRASADQANELVMKNPILTALAQSIGWSPWSVAAAQAPTGARTGVAPTTPGKPVAPKGGTTHFTVGGKDYDIPNDQVARFKKAKGIK